MTNSDRIHRIVPQQLVWLGLILLGALLQNAVADDSASGSVNVRIGITKPASVNTDDPILWLDQTNGFSSPLCFVALSGTPPFTIELDSESSLGQTAALENYTADIDVTFAAASRATDTSKTCVQTNGQTVAVSLDPAVFGNVSTNTYLGNLAVYIRPE